MAVNLRKNTDTGMPMPEPRRQIAKTTELEGEMTSEDTTDLKMEQEVCGMEHTLNLKEWKARKILTMRINSKPA